MLPTSRRLVALISALTLPAGCAGPAPERPSAAAEAEAAFDLGDFGSFRGAAPALHLAVHAALMRDSTIMYFAGSQNEPTRVFGNNNYAIWDPTTETSTKIAGPDRDDLFCAGHAHLPDGKLLIAGGNQYYPPPWDKGHAGEEHYTGHGQTWTYDYRTRSFERGGDMAGGRWYPTVVRGPGGDHGMLVLEGHPDGDNPSHENVTVESGPVSGAGPWAISGSYDGYEFQYYPRAHAIGGGEVFVASPREDLRNVSFVLDPANGALATVDRGPAMITDLSYVGYNTTTALLPYRPQSDGSYKRGDVIRLCGLQADIKRVDEGTNAQWVPTSPRPSGPKGEAPGFRKHCNAVLLPTGEILVVGGVAEHVKDGWYGSEDTSVYHTEIYRPEINRWFRGPSSAISRTYHSNALLLPDGRVWLTGGNKRTGFSVTGQPDGEGRELRIELFEPWYHAHPNRPQIASLQRIGARRLRVVTDRAHDIAEVLLMAPGSATHMFDVDQLAVYVPIVARDGSALEATIPDDAPLRPGDYLVFVTVRVDGQPSPVLPSRGSWIELP